MDQQPPKQDFSLTLNKINPNEKVLAVIKRHPFGIIRLYISAVLGLILAGGLLIFLMAELLPRDNNSGLYAAGGIVAAVIIAFMALVMVISTIIYYKSNFVITDRSITQTLQISIFEKKVSQLDVSRIQDVTVEKHGLLETYLNYGRLLVETAGEQENFHFDFCPNPDHYARLILDSRQNYLEGHEIRMQMPQQPQAPQQQYAQPQYDAPQQPQAPQQQYAQPQNPDIYQ